MTCQVTNQIVVAHHHPGGHRIDRPGAPQPPDMLEVCPAVLERLGLVAALAQLLLVDIKPLSQCLLRSDSECRRGNPRRLTWLGRQQTQRLSQQVKRGGKFGCIHGHRQGMGSDVKVFIAGHVAHG